MTREEAVAKLNAAKGDLSIFKEQMAKRPSISSQDQSTTIGELESKVAAAQKDLDAFDKVEE